MLDQPVPNPLAKNPNVYTHKVFAAIGLILIGAIVLLAGLWWYVDNQSGPKLPENEDTGTKTATSSAKKATESTKKDETADWTTYVGETIAVSFKIPQEFSVKDQKGAIGNTYYEGLIEVKDSKGNGVFSVVKAGTGITAYFLRGEAIVTEGIKGNKNYYTNYKDPSDLNSGPDSQTPKYVLISYSEKDFSITYSYSKEVEELMTKILSTFKFI